MVELSPPASQTRGVLKNIQALRALAALMVVFVHLDELAIAAGARPGLFEAGNAGVDLFFVVSGLIMVLTTWGRPTTPWEFLVNRVKRVVPLYWLITIAVFALAVLAPSLLQATRADPVQLVKSLAFIPFVKANGLVQPVVFVGWTLNYEMAFYAVFALALFSRGRWLRIALPSALIVGAVVVGLVAKPQSVAAAFYTRPVILEFALGMWLAAWFASARAASRLGCWASALGVAVGFALLIVAPLAWPAVDRAIAYGLPALMIVFCALVLERSNFKASAGWVQRIGDASYSIYLTHFFVTQAATKAHAVLHLGKVGALVLIPVTLAGVVAVGIAVHLWIERPLSRLLARRQ